MSQLGWIGAEATHPPAVHIASTFQDAHIAELKSEEHTVH